MTLLEAAENMMRQWKWEHPKGSCPGDGKHHASGNDDCNACQLERAIKAERQG